ncbi:MAG: cytochrome c [Desulfurivibrio sp.]|nr:cytochrome c [Desulfurivibrio sp.]MBU3937420.1 cytochrome c [Pseudomonadota bacterium]MBU4033870.1 cytochrome c [Pseudomonadota bacterium]MBU4118915.1 cytochrome c [Pseudomonadota bacterium]
MKKRIAIIVVVGAFVALLSQGLVFAGETTYRFDPVTQTSRAMEFKNTYDGYKLFQSNCKSCHFRGNSKGARFLDTDSRTMHGWNNVFYKKNVPCAKDDSWAKLSKEDLLAINDYLYSKAYDTWDPRSAKSCA